MTHPIQCQCGKLRGHLELKGVSSRVVCFCASCQAFARFLGKAEDVFDDHGGTEILQVSQSRLQFTEGKQYLAAVRLSENGLIRWYAACCKTPIGNTLANPKVSFIGLIHTALEREKVPADFGKTIAIVNVDAARGEPKPKQKGFFGMMLRFMGMVIPARITGSYKKSALFDEKGNLIVSPKVLTSEERATFKYPAEHRPDHETIMKKG